MSDEFVVPGRETQADFGLGDRPYQPASELTFIPPDIGNVIAVPMGKCSVIGRLTTHRGELLRLEGRVWYRDDLQNALSFCEGYLSVLDAQRDKPEDPLAKGNAGGVILLNSAYTKPHEIIRVGNLDAKHLQSATWQDFRGTPCISSNLCFIPSDPRSRNRPRTLEDVYVMDVTPRCLSFSEDQHPGGTFTNVLLSSIVYIETADR